MCGEPSLAGNRKRIPLGDALDIATRYFDRPPDSAEYASVEMFAADAIMDEWKLGVRYKIVLANKVIAVIEDRHPLANELRRFAKQVNRELKGMEATLHPRSCIGHRQRCHPPAWPLQRRAIHGRHTQEK